MESTALAPGSLYRPGLEKICLFLAFPFLFAAIAELLSGNFGFGLLEDQRSYFTKLIYIFSLGPVHIFLSVFLLWSLPEMRAWTRSRFGGRPVFFAWHLVALFLLFFSMVWFGGGSYSQPAHWTILFAMLLVLNVARVHHGIAQTRGIALSYSQFFAKENALAPSEQKRFLQCERLEAFAFRLVMLGSLSALALYIVNPRDGFTWATSLQTSLFWISLGGSFLVVFAAHLSPGARFTPKAVFLWRIFLYPLQAYSFAAAMGSLFIHSIEYYMVVDKMVQKSEIDSRTRGRFYGAFLILAGLVLAFVLFRYSYVHTQGIAGAREGQGLLPTPHPLALAILAFNGSFDCIHYYLDRILFRMRNPDTRKNVGPLITGAWKQSPSA